MGSSRLPGKILKPLAGAPMIVRQLERVLRARTIDEVCVAVPDQPESDAIEQAVADLPVRIVRGDEDDVLSRYALAAEKCAADVILRNTSDCPFVDPVMLDTLVTLLNTSDASYVRTAMTHGVPHGYDAEVFRRKALDEAAAETRDPFEREHVTPFIWRNAKRFPAFHLDSFPNRRHMRLVVDFSEDYELAAAVYDRLYGEKPKFTDADLMDFLERNPEILQINQQHVENWSGYVQQIQ